MLLTEQKLEKYKQLMESYLIMEKLSGHYYRIYNDIVCPYNDKDNILCPSCGIETDSEIEIMRSIPYSNFEIIINPNNNEIIVNVYTYGLKKLKSQLFLYLEELINKNKEEIKIKDYGDFYMIYFKKDNIIISKLLELYFY